MTKNLLCAKGSAVRGWLEAEGCVTPPLKPACDKDAETCVWIRRRGTVTSASGNLHLPFRQTCLTEKRKKKSLKRISQLSTAYICPSSEALVHKALCYNKKENKLNTCQSNCELANGTRQMPHLVPWLVGARQRASRALMPGRSSRQGRRPSITPCDRPPPLPGAAKPGGCGEWTPATCR